MGFFDRIRSGLEAWGKRREVRERDFVAANAGWARPARSSPMTIAGASGVEIDREGLQAAFLDQSGRIAYYLDIETGEVAEHSAPGALTPPRYRRLPAR
ncbi:MAG TPA: hypothetical protein VLU46_06730, partial [Thermoanaerobaculia bacterium]|nr:hypothetical protein [Thermoanaerobaculia bacterium]